MAEERHADHGFVAERAVGEHAHQCAGLQALGELEHRVQAAQAHDVGRALGGHGGKRRLHLARVVLVHRHRHGPRAAAPERAHRLEAAEVAAHEQDAVRVEDPAAMHLDLEEVEAVLEQEHAVERDGGEGEEVAVLLGERGRRPRQRAR